MSEPIPGWYPPPSNDGLRRPWETVKPAEQPAVVVPWDRPLTLPPGLIDTRTMKLKGGMLLRDPREPVFFPGRPPQLVDSLWRLVLADGRRISIKTSIVLGRRPAARAEFPGAELETIDDPAKSVSKSHAVIVPWNDRIYVLDLGSMNGTTVAADGRRRTVPTTEYLEVPEDAVIEVGSYFLSVERADS